MVQVKDRSQSLNCITEELIASGRQLQDITDKKVDCLEAFVKHKNFADWLKKSLRGRNHIKLSCSFTCVMQIPNVSE